MINAPHSYNRQEKLKSRKLIEQLFSKGKAINAHPLRLMYIVPKEKIDAPLKVGVTVSSRNFKKAVDRNRIKRLLREAYRLNKNELQAHVVNTAQQIAVFIIYTDKTLPEFAVINEKTKVILNKLIKAISETASTNS